MFFFILFLLGISLIECTEKCYSGTILKFDEDVHGVNSSILYGYYHIEHVENTVLENYYQSLGFLKIFLNY